MTTPHLSVVPTTSAVRLPGLDQVPPGLAYQVQAAHDVAVAALETLLAESRQDADKNAEIADRLLRQADVHLAELRATRPVVDAARVLVAAWEQSGVAAQLLAASRGRAATFSNVGADLVRAVSAASAPAARRGRPVSSATVTPAQARALKHEGQEVAARRATSDDRAAVRDAVSRVPVGSWFCVNDLRADLDAAGVPSSARASLLAGVAREGLAERVDVRGPGGTPGWVVLGSSGRSAKGAGVTAYERVDPGAPT